MKFGRIALLVYAALILALFGAAAAFVLPVGRWGCASQAELERARTVEKSSARSQIAELSSFERNCRVLSGARARIGTPSLTGM